MQRESLLIFKQVVQAVFDVFRGLNVSTECSLKPHKVNRDNHFKRFHVAGNMGQKLLRSRWKQCDGNTGKILISN